MKISKLKDFLILIRWFHALLGLLPFIAIYLAIYYSAAKNNSCDLETLPFVVLCIGVQLLMIPGFILNDIIDRKIDKINKPNTRIVERVIPLKTSWSLFYVFSGILLILSVYISVTFFPEWALICTVVYFLSVAYNLYLKRSPLFGNITMAIITTGIPLVIAYYARECLYILNDEKLYVLIATYSLLPFLIIIPRELSLDISDMEGDIHDHCRTLPILIGVKKSKLIVKLFLILTIIISSIAVKFYSYLSIALIPMNLVIVYYILKIDKVEKRSDYIQLGKLLWISMIVALITTTIIYFVNT